MNKFFQSIFKFVANHLSEDQALMLICTGALGWILSSAAQIGALITNPNMSKKDKSYIIPQEINDACINILTFIGITTGFKHLTRKLFLTGKITTKTVRDYVKNYPELQEKMGKFDFNLKNIDYNKYQNFPKENFDSTKNLAETLATIGGGIISSNIITPILRNNIAANAQKNILNKDAEKTKKTIEINPTQINSISFKSYGIRI